MNGLYQGLMDLPSPICDAPPAPKPTDGRSRTVRHTHLTSAIETPSGKDQKYENFPVGSWLLPAHFRPHIATFYWFARTIDDIADSDSLSAEEKIERLSLFEATLKGEVSGNPGYERGDAMRSSLLETEISTQHCLDLIIAFKQDVTKFRYPDWSSLMDYCRYSAAPVGRYLIDLHGGSKTDYPPSDALCSALQILNHLQDCREDFEKMNRVYLPLDIMQKHKVKVDDLSRDVTSEGLRDVIQEVLNKTETLIDDSRPLIRRLVSLRLAMEAQSIINIAGCLVSELTRRDPLAERVRLSKWQYAGSCIVGVLVAIYTQLHAK